MINIRSILKLKDNDGMTLKAGKPICYKSGWQVATIGAQTTSPTIAMYFVKKFGGNCGVWFSKGVYYVDVSHRVATNREAMEIGKACHQLTILRWRDMAIIEVA